MPHTYSFFRLLVTLVLLGNTGVAWAQRPPQSWVYDSLGRPIRKNHELLVQFGTSVINLGAVSNPNGNQGPLHTFLKPAVANALQARLGFDLSSVYAIKMIARSTPADSLLVDASGQPLLPDPWWNWFLLCLPAGSDDYEVQEALREQPFSVVKSAGMNWALTQNGMTTSSSAAPFLMASDNASLLTYPQPAQNVLTFALPAPLPATAEITILTAAGKVVRTEKHQVYQRGELTPLQTDLSALPAGQYFYRVVTPKATYQGRLEKQD
ncbi:T9SS type A sorting domain-containing protein [Hymenobacter sp. BT523]|uniref:T9SS type A sorting domain-containing protein n=1 Tax=Hymenobacter sp. BT523 TaxID=2795725 RepID=UPI0018EB862F|nr:T9SS type A sorting domain-containing protein [Hymenobacter sp. BT523]MBJ6111535.1 T9SS type A sorting domain-containing protein [Hymenobacter sp. BT523]